MSISYRAHWASFLNLFDWDLFNHDSQVFGRGGNGGASTKQAVLAHPIC